MSKSDITIKQSECVANSGVSGIIDFDETTDKIIKEAKKYV